MTFEQFQKSKKPVTVGAGAEMLTMPEDWFEGGSALLVYEGLCYIQIQECGGYYLTIGRDEWIDTDLGKLEHRLYHDWYVPEILGEDA